MKTSRADAIDKGSSELGQEMARKISRILCALTGQVSCTDKQVNMLLDIIAAAIDFRQTLSTQRAEFHIEGDLGGNVWLPYEPKHADREEPAEPGTAKPNEVVVMITQPMLSRRGDNFKKSKVDGAPFQNRGEDEANKMLPGRRHSHSSQKQSRHTAENLNAALQQMICDTLQTMRNSRSCVRCLSEGRGNCNVIVTPI